MKTIAIAFAATITGILPLLAGDEAPPPTLAFEPLSLTISKFKRDNFGKGVNPFRMDMNAVSGVSLTAQVTMDGDWAERIVLDACKLKRFTDDRQTNLLADEVNKVDSFWEDNRPFSVAPTRGKDGLSVIMRGIRIPAKGAQKLFIEGELVFAPKGSEKEERGGGMELQNNEVVELEPVQLRFSQPVARPGLQGGKADQETWYVQVLPREGVSGVKLLLFGKDEDVPIFGGSNGGGRMTVSGGRKEGGDNPFQGVSMQGFSCPAGKLSRIVVRYTATENLVKVPFKWETGLDLGGSSKENFD